MLYQAELEALSEEALAHLRDAVTRSVVVVRHELFGGGYDVWWREDIERFRVQNPGLVADFALEPATLETAWEYLELVDGALWPSEARPLFTVWPRDAYAEVIVADEE